MRDFLPDNVALLDKLEGMLYHPGATRPKLREVESILTWSSCLFHMIAIQAAVNPAKVADMCAYGSIVIREAQKHGGEGWQVYDSLFRQHAATRPDISWASLDPSIHAATFLAMRSGTGIHCHHYADSDHQSTACALAPLRAPLPPTLAAGSALSPLPGPMRMQELRSSDQRPMQRPICHSWNRGRCAYAPSCSYRHVCVSCHLGPHQAKDCSRTPADSIFWRPYIPATQRHSLRDQGHSIASGNSRP